MANVFVLPSALLAPELKSITLKASDSHDSAPLDEIVARPGRDLISLFAEDDGVALVHCAPDGTILEQNAAFEALNAACFGQSRIALPQAQHHLEQVMLTGRAVTAQLVLEVGGGTRHDIAHDNSGVAGLTLRHLRARYLPVKDSSSVITSIAGAFHDWTADVAVLERAAQDSARFRDFARAAGDWFWELDADQRLVSVSDKVAAVTGVPAAAYVGQSFDAIGQLEPTAQRVVPLREAYRARTPFRDQGLRLEAPDAPPRFFTLAGVPIFDDAGQFQGFRGAAVDTSQAQAQAQRERLKSRQLQTELDVLQRENATLDLATVDAQSALRAKDEFLAAMSHELRTPLNAIIGFAETMELQLFGALDPHYVAYARDIHQAGQHLLGLINEVLDVSVIESGEVTLSRESVAIDRLVDQARALVMLRAQHKNLDISQVRAGSGWAVLGDERRVLQILVNLLTNAVKFTPPGGRIGVDIQRASSGVSARAIDISVWDTGPGIGSADHERAFEKFQQIVGHSFSGKPEGTGLGLHISRELARLMGGDISLVSSLGAGARFTVSLPAAV